MLKTGNSIDSPIEPLILGPSFDFSLHSISFVKNASSSDLAQKLFFYGLGAGAATLAAASSANATIYYSGPLSFSGSSFSFDLENTAAPTINPATGADFTLTSSIKSSATNKISTSGAGSGVVAENRSNNNNGTATYALKLAAGDTIGSNRSFISGSPYFNTLPLSARGAGTDALAGDWLPGDRGFVGLTIILDGTGEAGPGAAGTLVYGWADVTVNNFDGTGLGRYTLNGYAYESDGGSIPAGAVPEPSTVALLIAGAAGVEVMRRRRNARKS